MKELKNVSLGRDTYLIHSSTLFDKANYFACESVIRILKKITLRSELNYEGSNLFMLYFGEN